jgi:regulation of enolase protein 1 (concanavalin A-like superfamily)
MAASILLAALVFPLQAREAPATGWQTVASEAGDYTVEMPSAPNYRSTRTRSAGGGPGRVLIRGCRTAAGNYLVEKMEYPTGMIAGSEDSQLDTERDELAREFGGNPTGERRIRLDGKHPGREFTIRGKPKGETGVVTVLVREYVVGKALYALMVSSQANRELPEDADQFLNSLKLKAGAATKPAVASAPASSSPAPAKGRRPAAKAARSAGAERAIEGWGTASDPDGDCKIETEGKTLTMEVPNTPHGLASNIIDRSNAPRVLREVEGDFEVQVKVDGTFTPTGSGTTLRDMPTTEAGLVLINDADNYITLLRSASYRNDKTNTSVAVSHRTEGRGSGMRLPRIGKDTTYLRLVRKSSKFLPYASTDGKTWEALRPVDVDWPGRLKLGVTALTMGTEKPFSVTFDELTLKAKEPGAEGAGR